MGIVPIEAGRASPRITRGRDIRGVLSRGQRVAGERVIAYVEPADETRVGFICSRTVGGAVARNRAKRLLREAWRALAPRAIGGHSIMLVARPGIAGVGTAEVTRDLERVLTLGGVIA